MRHPISPFGSADCEPFPTLWHAECCVRADTDRVVSLRELFPLGSVGLSRISLSRVRAHERFRGWPDGGVIHSFVDGR